MSAELRYGPDEFLGGPPRGETVESPPWYTSGAIETCDKVEAVIDGLPAREAWCLGQVLRYFCLLYTSDAADD